MSLLRISTETLGNLYYVFVYDSVMEEGECKSSVSTMGMVKRGGAEKGALSRL